MTFTQFFSILKARWLVALLVLAVVVAGALGVSLILPKKYTASGSVLVDVRLPDPVAGTMMAGPGYMSTQVDVIASERVARRAIRSLGLQDNEALRGDWLETTKGVGDFESWLAERLLQPLEVKPSRESNVITIEYSAADGRFAAALANAFMQAYIDTTVELRVEPAKRYNTFFDDRAKQLRDALEAAQTQLSNFQKDKGIVVTEGRLDLENSRLAELSSQLVMLQAVAAESGSRQVQAGTRPEQMPEVLGNSVVATLSADLAREEIRLKELMSRLGDSHPQVVEQRVRLAELKSRIDAATARASGSVNVNANVNQSRVAQVRAALDAQRTKVVGLKSVRDEAAVLQRDVENAQRAYDSMLSRVTQTNVESQNTQTNVSVLKRAAPPPFPSSPNIRRNSLVAVFLGTLLAVGFAMLLELIDRRLRTASDVITELKQPLLIVLPVARHGVQGPDTSRVKQIKARVMSGLPKPALKP